VSTPGAGCINIVDVIREYDVMVDGFKKTFMTSQMDVHKMLADFKGDLSVNYGDSFNKMYDSMFGDTNSIASAQKMPWGTSWTDFKQDWEKADAYFEGLYGVVEGGGKFYNKASGKFSNEFDIGATDAEKAAYSKKMSDIINGPNNDGTGKLPKFLAKYFPQNHTLDNKPFENGEVMGLPPYLVDMRRISRIITDKLKWITDVFGGFVRLILKASHPVVIAALNDYVRHHKIIAFMQILDDYDVNFMIYHFMRKHIPQYRFFRID
jgi:hypothetical protein